MVASKERQWRDRYRTQQLSDPVIRSLPAYANDAGIKPSLLCAGPVHDATPCHVINDLLRTLHFLYCTLPFLLESLKHDWSNFMETWSLQPAANDTPAGAACAMTTHDLSSNLPWKAQAVLGLRDRIRYYGYPFGVWMTAFTIVQASRAQSPS